MKAEGSAFAAVSILNATATGIGCALAIEGGVRATWQPAAAMRFRSQPACDDAVARAVARHVGGPAEVETHSTFPASRGLKTSSASAAALLRAAAASQGATADDRDVLGAGVAVCRAAGVTLTGAMDDQAAVTLGGCHVAAVRTDRILHSISVPRWHVAVWVPEQAIPKPSAAGIDATVLAKRVRLPRDAESLPDAMTENGRLFTRLYAAAGFPVGEVPATAALGAGALGAGLSGTGPAVAALFDTPAKLPAVPGGLWHWTRVAVRP